MTRVVLSIGSNVGDRLALPAVGGRRARARRSAPCRRCTRRTRGAASSRARSSTPSLIADDAGAGLSRRGCAAGRNWNGRPTGRANVHWGPRTLDVDLITCHDGDDEVTSADEVLTLPHPLRAPAGLRARPVARRRPGGHADGGRSVATRRDAARRPGRGASATGSGRRRPGPGDLMGPTRKRDLTIATVVVAILGYVVACAAVSVVPADHGLDRGVAARRWPSPRRAGRSTSGPRSATARSAIGPGRLHPLAVARAVMIAKASAWVGCAGPRLVAGRAGVSSCRTGASCGSPARTRAGAVVAAAECAGAGGRRALAAALLQVAGRAARRRRRRARLARLSS